MFTPKALNTSRPRTGKRVSALKSASRNDSLNTSSTTALGASPSFSLTATQTLNFATNQHKLEPYGRLLPVSVTEVVSCIDKDAIASICLNEYGWASLVVDRKLLVWKYKVNNAFAKNPQCLELNFPPSEMPCTASLVSVLPSYEDDQSPACLLITPEGTVRYWPSANQSSSYVENSIDTKDEAISAVRVVKQRSECVHYVAVGRFSTLYMITPIQSSTNLLKIRPFHKPSGMLTGISRRMSTLIFGSGAAVESSGSQTEMKALICGEIMNEEGGSMYLLSGDNMQKWSVLGEGTSSSERMLYQQNVTRIMRESLAEVVWKQQVQDLNKLEVWILDIQLSGDDVMVLGAGYNPEVSKQVHFGLGTLHTEGSDPPQSFLSFCVPQFTHTYNTTDNKWLKMRLLVSDQRRGGSVYFYDDHMVMCISVTSPEQAVDKVEFISPGDKLLGGGICDNSALFFSTVHGIVTIKEIGPQSMAVSGGDQSVHSFAMETSHSMMEESIERLSCSVTEDQIVEMSMSEDFLQKLKAAFLHFVTGHRIEAQTIVEELFVWGSQRGSLDTLVATVSEDIVNDIPTRDPRWAHNHRLGSGASLGSGSLILMHQLDDKLKAHECFVKFLKTMQLWEELSTVGKTSPQPTRALLCEHGEKIVSTRQLSELHQQYGTIVDAAIERVMTSRRSEDLDMKSVGLATQDLFYRKVSKLEEVFEELIAHEEEYLGQGDVGPRETYSMISAVNNILYNSLFAAYQYRITKRHFYESDDEELAGDRGPPEKVSRSGAINTPESVPWTGSLGPSGLREVMTRQYYISINQGLSEVGDSDEKENLFQQIMDMADMVLDGYKIQLESLKAATATQSSSKSSAAVDKSQEADVIKNYQEQRTALLSPFLRHEQYERAASLAEKYCDFGILVEMCELTGNEVRLQKYMEEFGNRGFPDFVFRWYVEQGKRGKLLASSLANHPELSQFLQGTNNKFMSWLNDIYAKDFQKAHYSLMDLADQETQYLGKKKTLLSLGKLSALACNDSENIPVDNVCSINVQQDLILHQEHLPPSVLENLGISDAETMKVLTPAKLIELYVSDYNSSPTEFDFKKALDLLQYLDGCGDNVLEADGDSGDDVAADSSVRQELILLIWSKAILHDNWGVISPQNLLEDFKNTLFYKTVEMVQSDSDVTLQTLLPNVDTLLECELLAPMKDNNKKFEYLIRASFEHIQRTAATSSA